MFPLLIGTAALRIKTKQLYQEKGCAKPKGAEYRKLVSKTLSELADLKDKYVRGMISEDDYILTRKQLLIVFD